MVDQNYTHVVLLIDRSGSMSTVHSETINGLNHFVEQQRAVDGKCLLDAWGFDDKLEQVIDSLPVADVKAFTNEDFTPRGWTALCDSIGVVVKSLGDRFSALKESDRPRRVLFVIMTDGHENASQGYTYDSVREMIIHQTDVYSWDFVFLGADIDVPKVQSHLGIADAYTFNKMDVGDAIAAVGKAAAGYRTSGTQSFHSNIVLNSTYLKATPQTISRNTVE